MSDQIKQYTKAYIAKKSDTEKAMQWLSLIHAHLVHFSKEDAGSINIPAYIFCYKGVGSRRVLQGILYCKVDVGAVGEFFIDIWPRSLLLKIGNPVQKSGPIRCAYDGDRVYKVI